MTHSEFTAVRQKELPEKILEQFSAERLAHHLTKTGDYKVLRRLTLPQGYLIDDRGETCVGIAVDVETTGLDAGHDKIIELAMRRFRYNGDGIITKLDRPYVWREDPGEPLDPAISRLTGLTDSDLLGTAIYDSKAVELLHSAKLCIAHNAAFDRRFIRATPAGVRRKGVGLHFQGNRLDRARFRWQRPHPELAFGSARLLSRSTSGISRRRCFDFRSVAPKF